MSAYNFYIVIEGEGLTPQSRSHWSFAFQRTDSSIADILQVLLLDDTRLVYQLDWRAGIPFPIRGSEGAIKLAEISRGEYLRAQESISKELPPRNGKDRCQDWVLNCVVGMEVEGVVKEGTAEFVGGLVGLSAEDVKQQAEGKWVEMYGIRT